MGGRRLIEEDPDDIGTGPPAPAPEDDLVAVVVPRGDLAELAVSHGPAGEGPRRLIDVGLTVMTDPQGEELHQLAGQVLVGMPLAIGRRVEPNQERGVADHRPEQLAERLAGEAA